MIALLHRIRRAIGIWLLGKRYVLESAHEHAITVLQNRSDYLARELAEVTAFTKGVSMLALQVSRRLDELEAAPAETSLSARVAKLELALMPAISDEAAEGAYSAVWAQLAKERGDT